MKTKNLLFAIIILLPIGLMAQSNLTISANYSPYESTILINLVNNTDKPMRIRNNYGGGTSGSLIQFHLKDKASKEISMYEATFYEGVNYQRFVDISPHSAKTIRYPLKSLCPSSRNVSEVYSVDASCFINYSIPEENRYDHFDKVLSIKTNQDLMIYSGYDSHAKKIMITLFNTSDFEMIVHNGGTYIQFRFLNQQGTKLSARSFPFILHESGTSPYSIKIAPRSNVTLAYLLSNISTGLAESAITTVEADCSAIYDIPTQGLTNKSSQRTCIIKIKYP